MTGTNGASKDRSRSPRKELKAGRGLGVSGMLSRHSRGCTNVYDVG